MKNKKKKSSDFSFSVRTKGNAKPFGKPRVYFTCHPADFKNTFERIWSDISNAQDCAFYYTKDMQSSIPDEYRDTDLGRMNLFVIPVTTRLLLQPNRAFDSDFRFAMDHHIPILPIMMESGLDEVYGRPDKFGTIQYLAPNSNDITEISYAEKLKKYLHTVLISDEDSKRIRNAFHAYIFLSYRRNDRRLANELMRYIHTIPELQDIAIWYDEFLIPGESFEKNIEKMLAQSKIFTLLVTKLLLEKPKGKPNYIMSVEYPAAKKMADKKELLILPTKISRKNNSGDINKTDLDNSFPGIPNCLDPNSAIEILKEAFHRTSKHRNDDPLHSFLIGLAYLEGVDMEVNYSHAIKMITLAGKKGLQEAIKKLVSMYSSGIGVPRDYNEAIKWQKKYISSLQSSYASTGNSSDLRSLISAVWDLGNRLRDIGDLKNAQNAYKRMLRLSKEYHKDNLIEARRYLMVSYGNLGDLAEARERISSAHRYYKKALEVSESIVKEESTALSRRDLSISFERLGNVLKAKGDLDGALSFFEKDLTLSTELAEESGAHSARNDLSVSYERIGDILRAKGRLNEAREMYVKSFNINKTIADEIGSAEAFRGMSVNYIKIGDIAQENEDLAEAQRYFEKALNINLELVKETGTILSRRNLWINYGKLGDTMEAQGNTNDARKYYAEAFLLCKSLAEETDTVLSRKDLSVIYSRLGDFSEANEDQQNAYVYYKKALEISLAVSEETDSIDSKRALATNYSKLGDLIKAKGNYNDALQKYEEAFNITKKIAESSENIAARKDLAISYSKMGDIALENSSDYMTAYSHYKKAFDLCSAIAKETGNLENHNDLWLCHIKLGDISLKKEDLDAADFYYKKAFQLSKMLTNKTDSLRSERTFFYSYNKLGDVSVARKKYSQALKYYIKALDISKAIADKANSAQARRDLSVNLERVGDVMNHFQKYNDALNYYEKALNLRKELAEKNATIQARMDLLHIYRALGALSEGNDPDIARQYYEKDYELSNSLANEVGNVESLECLLFACGKMGELMENIDCQKAKYYYQKDLEISKKLASELKTVNAYDDLATAYYKLAQVSHPLDAALLQRSYDIFSFLANQCPNDERFKDCCAIIKNLL